MISVVLAVLAASAVPAEAPTSAQARGREIFFKGETISGRPVGAALGDRRESLPAKLLPCAGCHGDDGQGRSEGGVRPPAITPQALGHGSTVGARMRPAYSKALLRRAVTQGIDAGGHRLDRAMPRYRMSSQDVDDLLAYLDIVGTEPTAGVTDNAIRINVVGAPGLVAPLQAIYGRRIELRHGRGADAFMTLDASPDGSASVEVAARDGMPTIAFTAGDARPGHHAFIVSASRDDEARALRQYAQASGLQGVLFTDDCRGLAAVPAGSMALVSSHAAAGCDLREVPTALDRRVVVAAAAPPGADAEAMAQAQLAVVARLLAGLGRDLTRSALLAALEHAYRLDAPGLAPITWGVNRRFGGNAVWLMTLDARGQRLLGEPGWVEVQAFPTGVDR